jgi:uncharacterized membrane protein
MTYIAEFYGTLFEVIICIFAIVVVPYLVVAFVYCFVMMIQSQAECDREIRSEAWVRLVKQTRKVRALRKEAAEYKPLGSKTWTTHS